MSQQQARQGARRANRPQRDSEGLKSSKVKVSVRDASGRVRAGNRQKQASTAQIAKVIKAAMREAEFQRIVRSTLTALGFVVWVFPIMKRTMAGVPDLTFWHPMKPGRLHFWELKTEKGRIRPEQVVAIAHLSTVPGVDARIVRPSDWEALRDALVKGAR